MASPVIDFLEPIERSDKCNTPNSIGLISAAYNGIRGIPPARLATWPQALIKWDALSEQAQIELRRALDP